MAAAVSQLRRRHTIMPDMDSEKETDSIRAVSSPTATEERKQTETDDVEEDVNEELNVEDEGQDAAEINHEEERKEEKQSKETDTKVDGDDDHYVEVEDISEECEEKVENGEVENEAEIVELEEVVNSYQLEQSLVDASQDEEDRIRQDERSAEATTEIQDEVEEVDKEDECLIIEENIEPERKSPVAQNVSSAPKPGRRKRSSHSIEMSTTPITARKKIKMSSCGSKKRIIEEVYADGASIDASSSRFSTSGGTNIPLPKLIVTNTAEDRSVEEIEMLMLDLREEIQALHHFAKQKEREWTKLIRLKKLKEELYLRLQRRIQMMENMGLVIPRPYYSTPAPRLKRENSLSTGISVSPISISTLTQSGGKFVSAATGSVSSTQSINNGTLSSSIMPPMPQVIMPQSTVQFLKPQQLPHQLPVMMFQPLNTALPSVSQSASPTVPLRNSITTPSPSFRTFPDESLQLMQSNKQSKRKQSLTPRDATLSSDVIPIGTTTVTTSRIHRPILPKPSTLSPGSIPGQLNSVIGEGRQGPIVDVRSIIADYRSKHPEEVPRRGKRIRSVLSGDKSSEEGDVSPKLVTSAAGSILNMSSIVHGSGAQVRTSIGDVIEVGSLLGDGSRCVMSTVGQDSRPSSADSSRSGAHGPDTNISFKDVLLQFAKLSQSEHDSSAEAPSSSVNKLTFPEVTLHPVNNGTVSPPISSSSSATSSSQSLLHGILSKPGVSQKDLKSSTFSPTLARLLTAPERHTTGGSSQFSTLQAAGRLSLNDLLAVSKSQGEITITPVNAMQSAKPKEEVVIVEEDADDSGDRLVIDESAQPDDGGAESTSEDNAKEGLECQGCHERIAQFVCAGCGNQWYCSRECQVSAWEEHCEVCSG